MIMSEITLKFSFPENCSYGVKAGKIEKIIDSSHPVVSFQLENGQHEICIEQFFSPEASGLFVRILKIVSLPLSGLLNIVAFNTDMDWEKDICAYGLKATLKLSVCENAEYDISLINSSFSWQTESFTKPSLTVLPNLEVKTEFIENEGSIDLSFEKFIRRTYSVFSVILLLAGFMIYNAVADGKNISLTAICVTVTIFLFVGQILINLKNERKRKEIHRIFNSKK